jgi:hypothetical protein
MQKECRSEILGIGLIRRGGTCCALPDKMPGIREDVKCARYDQLSGLHGEIIICGLVGTAQGEA